MAADVSSVLRLISFHQDMVAVGHFLLGELEACGQSEEDTSDCEKKISDLFARILTRAPDHFAFCASSKDERIRDYGVLLTGKLSDLRAKVGSAQVATNRLGCLPMKVREES